MKRFNFIVCILTIAFVLFSGTTVFAAESKIACPQKVNLKIEAYDKISINWSKVKKADGYMIYCAENSTKNFKLIKTIRSANTTKYVHKIKKTNKKYYYKIKSYCQNGKKKIYSKFSSTKSLKMLPLGKVEQLEISVTEKYSDSVALSMTWSKVKNAKGYNIYEQKNDGNFVKVLTTSKNECKKKVKSNTTYKYYICAYASINGKNEEGESSELNEIVIPKLKNDYNNEIKDINALVNLVKPMAQDEAKTNKINELKEKKKNYDKYVDDKLREIGTPNITWSNENEYQRKTKAIGNELAKYKAQYAVATLDTSREGKAKAAKLLEKINSLTAELEALQEASAKQAKIDALREAKEAYDKNIDNQISNVMVTQAEVLEQAYILIDQRAYNGLKYTIVTYWKKSMDTTRIYEIYDNADNVLNLYGGSVSNVIGEINQLYQAA